MSNVDMWGPIAGGVCEACGGNACPTLQVWALCAICRGVDINIAQDQESVDSVDRS
jgi:hypothetical protein